MSHAAWRSVVPHLCTLRRVIAFDIAGFGSTPPLPSDVPPTIPNLVDALERSLEEMGVERPVDIAGNSLGGCLALEAARRGVARSVVAIGPSGLWSTHTAPHVPYVFGTLRFTTRHFPRLSRAAMRVSLLRELILAVPVSVGSRHMPTADALRAANDFARSPAFEATFNHTKAPFSGREIDVPVTVAFGDRDWIITRRSRGRSELPAHTKWVEKRGWGHVPMWVDPPGVAQLILEGCS